MHGGPFTPDPGLRGRSDDDDGSTLVIDDESGAGETSWAIDDKATSRRRPLPRLRIAQPPLRDSAASGLVGLALTAIFLLGIVISATRVVSLANASLDAGASMADERIVFWTPDALANPEDPAIEEESGTPAPRPSLTSPPVSTQLPGSLTPSAPRDTVQGSAPDANARGETLLRPVVPGGTLPSPGRLGSAAATAAARPGRTGCAAPCREAAAVGMAPGTELARRDSILAAKMQEVVEKAGPPRAPGTIYFPLPFGGPTKEERQRDSTLHAEYRERLRAFMQRYDSLKADSLARGLIKP